jgi:hypothetical protein
VRLGRLHPLQGGFGTAFHVFGAGIIVFHQGWVA